MQEDLKPKNLREAAYGIGSAVLGAGKSYISEGYKGAKEGSEYYRNLGWEKGTKYGQELGSRVGRDVGGALGEATGHSVSAGIQSFLNSNHVSSLGLEDVLKTCDRACEDYPEKTDCSKLIRYGLDASLGQVGREIGSEVGEKVGGFTGYYTGGTVGYSAGALGGAMVCGIKRGLSAVPEGAREGWREGIQYSREGKKSN